MVVWPAIGARDAAGALDPGPALEGGSDGAGPGVEDGVASGDGALHAPRARAAAASMWSGRRGIVPIVAETDPARAAAFRIG